MSGLFSAMLTAIGQSLLADIATKALRRITDQRAVQNAIADTDSYFAGVENVSASLTKWCQAESFRGLLEDAVHGHPPDLDRLARDFAAISDFHDPDPNRSLARRVVEVFLDHLERELLTGSSGNYIAEFREQARFRHLAQGQDETKMIIQRGFAELRELAALPSGSISHATLNARIEDARTLIDRGQPRQALIALEHLYQSPEATDSDAATRARLLTALGAAAIRADESIRAQECLRLLWLSIPPRQRSSPTSPLCPS